MIDDLLQKMNNLQTKDVDTYNILVQAFSYFYDSLSDLQDKADSVVDEFINYQKARVVCFKTMILLQGASYCAACDPEYATNGIDTDGTVTMSADSCTLIKQRCYPFLAHSVAQSLVLRLQRIGHMVSSANHILDQINDKKLTITQLSDVPALDDGNAPKSVDQEEVELPDGCTDQDNCDWLCSGVFTKGKVDLNHMGSGGNPVDFTDPANQKDKDGKPLGGGLGDQPSQPPPPPPTDNVPKRQDNPKKGGKPAASGSSASGSGSAPPSGSGSAPPSGSGSAPPSGSGSSAPPVRLLATGTFSYDEADLGYTAEVTQDPGNTEATSSSMKLMISSLTVLAITAIALFL